MHASVAMDERGTNVLGAGHASPKISGDAPAGMSDDDAFCKMRSSLQWPAWLIGRLPGYGTPAG